MSDAVVFQIEAGQFGLALVDKAAVGYLDSWQAPGGKTVDVVLIDDYDESSATFQCQITSGAITATADTTTVDIPATWCNPAKSVPQPAETSFSLEASFLQDPNVAAGLSRFLFENDTQEAYFYLGLDDGNPPKAIGRVRVIAGSFGGAARATLTADVTMPCSRKPDVQFGDATASAIVKGDGTVIDPVPPGVAAAAAPAPAMATSSSGE